MNKSVSISEKKEFIGWFLNRYELQKKEAAWLLSYLSSNDQLLQKLHFVDNVRYVSKSMILSTKCSNMTPFKFTKNKRVGADVETAFYDIRSYPHEDLYIGLYFKDRATCPEYAAVLEVNPMEKHDLAQDHLLSLFAEMLLDQAVEEFRQHELYRRIDDALAVRDEQTFLQLSEQWIKILESRK
ncbi:ReoY family proteolytic degradation factor [Paenactinomyces guangxiensis]|uniref:YpiB family protein n=1 Tax=Paenactinomyces guangxiensis TaxID=1490290 RepID=A0A7W1WU24_9BACL|nr:ReoY family proteolytic degradation factor [Paenactinomyces guangxiensis]MBA4496059.1 YpiB family protein [Paenactinomyces guangxiensis]MBH8593147.1 YpiB family protein [Paenactinomyces guangxiensis]